MHIKTFAVLLGFSVGITVGKIFLYATEIALTFCLLGVLQLCLLHYERKGEQSGGVKNDDDEHFVHRHFSLPLLSGLFFISIFLGIVRIQFVEEKNNFACEKVCEVSATISSSPKVQDENQTFVVTPTAISDIYDIFIKAPLYPRYQKGDEIVLLGKIQETKHAYQHGERKFFDYNTYLRIHGIGSEMVYPKIRMIQKNNSRSITALLEHVREKSVSTISMYVSAPAASLATGMLFGISSMSKELVTTFRVAGLSHIVVVSGFNIAILVSVIFSLFIFLPLMLRIIFSAGVIVLFVIMVGGETSIIRASCMSCIALGALAVGRGYAAKQALLLSLFAIVVYQPEHLLYDASLHLSFLATAGIVYMSEGLQSSLGNIKSVTYREIIVTTLAAYVMTLPYSMYAFGSISVYALIANLTVLPLVPFAMLLTCVTVLVSVFSTTLATMFGYVTTLLINWILGVAHFVEELPLASLPIVISLQTMLILYCVIIVLFILFTNKKKNETSGTKSTFPLSDVISY